MNRQNLSFAIAVVLAIPSCWKCFQAGQSARKTFFHLLLHPDDDPSMTQIVSKLFREVAADVLQNSKLTYPQFLPTSDELDVRRQAILTSSSSDNEEARQHPQDDTSPSFMLPDPLWYPALLSHPKPQRIGIVTTADTMDYDAARLELILPEFSSVSRVHLVVFQPHADKEQQDDHEAKMKGCGNGDYMIDIQRHVVDYENIDEGSFCSRWVLSSSLPIDILLVRVSASSYLDQKVLAKCFKELANSGTGSDFMWIMEEPKQLAPDFRYGFVDKLSSLEQRWIVTEYPFGSSRNFIVIQKPETQALWHLNEAEWNLLLNQKLQRPNSACDSLLLLTLEYPSKASEVEFCRRNSEDPYCLIGGSGFDPEQPNTPLSQLFVAKSLQGEHAGRGVFAGREIPEDSYIGLEYPEYISCSWTCWDLLHRLLAAMPTLGHQSVYRNMFGYGCVVNQWGRPEARGEPTLMCFVNHGCNGTYNINHESEAHEFTIDLPPEEILRKFKQGNLTRAEEERLQQLIPADLRSELTAVQYRPIRNSDKVSSYALKDIKAGSELLDNYMVFTGAEAVSFWPYVVSLKQECLGMEGVIEQWQNEKKVPKPSSEIPNRRHTECPLPLAQDSNFTESLTSCGTAAVLEQSV